MNILLVEDDAQLAPSIRRELEQSGYAVEHAFRGDDAYEAAGRRTFDLLIVDRMLPGLDGLSLVKNLRADGIKSPVLFLSNLSGLDDRVEGLEAGGDDYLGKPFAVAELLARVNALSRRPLYQEEARILRCADLEMDRIKRTVSRAGAPIQLQAREFALLEYLLKHKGQTVTRTMLLESVWNYRFDPKTRLVATHVSRLRAKVGEDLIHTVRQSGYMIQAPAAG